MKTILSALFVLLAFTTIAPLQSAQDCCEPVYECDSACEPVCCDDWFDLGSLNFVGKYSAFFPFSSKVGRIYNDALPCLELETNINVCGNWIGFFNAGYIWDEGRSLGLSNKTEFSLVPLTLGLKRLWCFGESTDVYLGAGLAYSYLSTHDHSEFVRQHTHKWGFGGIFKTGFYYYYSDCFFFEGFADYLYQPYNFASSSNDGHFVEGTHLDMSGIKVGLGIGMNW